jgi:hypothetical protein
VRRTIALWLVLFGVYAATVGLHAFGASEYGGDEPHYLLAAESIVHDRNLDVYDEYANRDYADFYPYPLDVHGKPTDGALNEPHGAGFPLLIAPAYAIGGPTGVELFLAAIAAIAVVLGYRLALRVVPDPWAIGAAAALGLSPPFIAYGTAVYPELSAGAAIAGAALLALRLDERISRADAFGCFALLGALPWLGTKFVLAGLMIGALAIRSLVRARRGTLAIGAVEVSLFSVALYVGINEALYGGPTPYSADISGETATDASFPLGYVERSYRLIALFIDRNYGLLRWAPVCALAFAGVWYLWRSHRDGLARAVPQMRRVELTAGLCACVLGVQLFVATFLAPTMFGFWFPGRHVLAALPMAVPLIAWGLRHLPRVGTALALVTVGGSAWLYFDVRLGGGALVTDRPDAPFGPLAQAFPLFDEGSVWPFALAGLIAVALALLVAWETRHSRQAAGATRARYSG